VQHDVTPLPELPPLPEDVPLLPGPPDEPTPLLELPLPDDEPVLPEDEDVLLPEDEVLPPLLEDDDAPPPEEEPPEDAPPDEEPVLASLASPASLAFAASPPTWATPSLADPESIASGSPSGNVSVPLVESRAAPPPSSPGRSEMPRSEPHPATRHWNDVSAINRASRARRIKLPPN
jgi:hypothetical protein